MAFKVCQHTRLKVGTWQSPLNWKQFVHRIFVRFVCSLAKNPLRTAPAASSSARPRELCVRAASTSCRPMPLLSRWKVPKTKRYIQYVFELIVSKSGDVVFDQVSSQRQTFELVQMPQIQRLRKYVSDEILCGNKAQKQRRSASKHTTALG